MCMFHPLVNWLVCYTAVVSSRNVRSHTAFFSVGLIGLQDSYQDIDRLVLCNVYMYDEFHVPDVLIHCVAVHVKTKLSKVLMQTRPIL